MQHAKHARLGAVTADEPCRHWEGHLKLGQQHSPTSCYFDQAQCDTEVALHGIQAEAPHRLHSVNAEALQLSDIQWTWHWWLMPAAPCRPGGRGPLWIAEVGAMPVEEARAEDREDTRSRAPDSGRPTAPRRPLPVPTNTPLPSL